jgi:sialic acid synthase SpsE
MAAGETLTFSDLEGKKPADGGIAVGELEHVLGRCLNRSKRQWEFLQKEDLE